MSGNNNPTFLTQLQQVLQAAPTQGTLTDEEVKFRAALYAQMQALFANKPGATVTDVFDEIQKATDHQIHRLNDLHTNNSNALSAAMVKMDAIKPVVKNGSHDTKLTIGSGHDAAIGADMAHALESTLTKDTLAQIEQIATNTGVPAGNGSHAITADFSGTFATEITRHEEATILRGNPYRNIADMDVNTHVTRPLAKNRSIGEHSTFIVRPGKYSGEHDVRTGKAVYATENTNLIGDDVIRDYLEAGEKTLHLIAVREKMKGPDGKWIEKPNGKIIREAQDLDLTKSREYNRQQIADWIKLETPLTQKNGHACVTDFDIHEIFVGQEIVTPKVHKPLHPQLQYVHCLKCDMDIKQDDQTIKVNLNGYVPSKPTPHIEKMVTLVPDFDKPSTFFRRNTHATYGKQFDQKSDDMAMMTRAAAGFNDAYFFIPENVARNPVIFSKQSGDSAKPVFQGKHAIGDGHPADDGLATESASGNSFVENVIGGYRNQVNIPYRGRHFSADGKTIDVEDKSFKAYSKGAKDYVTTGLIPFVKVHLGGLGGLPVGVAVDNVSKEEPLIATVDASGMMTAKSHQGNVFTHRDESVIFRNENAMVGAQMMSPDRINVGTMQGAINRAYTESMAKLSSSDASITDAARKQAAVDVLVAMRDNKSIITHEGLGSTKLPGLQDYAATREALTRYVGADYIAKVETEMSHDQVDLEAGNYKNFPITKVRFMSAEHRAALIKQGIPANRLPKETECDTEVPSTKTSVFHKDCFRTPTLYSWEVGSSNYKDPEMTDMVNDVRSATLKVIANPDALHTFQKFQETDLSGPESVSGALYKLAHHPEDALQKGEDKKLVKNTLEMLLGNGSDKTPEGVKLSKEDAAWRAEARRDILRSGDSSPILFVHDSPLPLRQPDLVMKLMQARRAENPEGFDKAYATMLDRLSDPSLGSKGGKPGTHAEVVGMFRNFGAETVGLGHVPGALPPGSASMMKHFPEQGDKDFFVQVTRDAAQYGEVGGAGRTVQGYERSDNNLRKAQFEHLDNKPAFDLATSFVKSNEIHFRGLQDQVLGRDIILASIYNNPGLYDHLEDKLKLHGYVEFDGLDDAIKHTEKGFAKYRKSGKAEDLLDAKQEFGDFFQKMSAKAYKKRGMINEGDWQALIGVVAEDKDLLSATMKTVDSHELLRDAFTRNILASQIKGEDANHTNFRDVRIQAHAKALEPIPNNDSLLAGDKVDNGLFFSVKSDEKGDAHYRKGFLGLGGKERVNINEEQETNFLRVIGAQNDAQLLNRGRQHLDVKDFVTSSEKTANGKITRLNDGTVIRNQKDGTVITEQPDGFIITRQKDGTLSGSAKNIDSKLSAKDQQAISDQMKRAAESIRTDDRDGSYISSHEDGSQTIYRTDGTVIIQKLGGITLTQQPNGKTKLTQAEAEHVTGPQSHPHQEAKDFVTSNEKTADGKVTRLNDGTVIHNQKNGTVITAQPDGVIITRQKDGTLSTALQPIDSTLSAQEQQTLAAQLKRAADSVTTNKDGSLVARHEDGSQTTYLKDGTVSIQKLNGTTLTQQPNGKTKLSQGAPLPGINREVAQLDDKALAASNLQQLRSSGRLNGATLEADEKLLDARAKVAALAFNLGDTNKNNVLNENPVIAFSKAEMERIATAGTPDDKLNVAAQLLVDRMQARAGNQNLPPIPGGMTHLEGARALIVDNRITLQDENKSRLTAVSFGLEATDKQSDFGRAANISTAWLLLGLGFIHGGGKMIKIIDVPDCCDPHIVTPPGPDGLGAAAKAAASLVTKGSGR